MSKRKRDLARLLLVAVLFGAAAVLIGIANVVGHSLAVTLLTSGALLCCLTGLQADRWRRL